MKTLIALMLGLAGMACGGTSSTATKTTGGGGAQGQGGDTPVAGLSGGTMGTGGKVGDGGATGKGGVESSGGVLGSGGVSANGGATVATGGSVPRSQGGSAGNPAGGAAGTRAGGLPEGPSGIAAKYKGDQNIATDPSVIFADDFESYADATGIGQRWDNVYQNQYVTLATAAANVYAGRQALEFILPQQTAELSDAVEKIVKPERDVLFLRYYSKFQPPYDVVGSSHNGSSISAHYFQNGNATPGIPANGTNKFLANLENWRGEAATASPGNLNIYIYHPEQRSQWGDHLFPTGLVMPNTSLPFDFGKDFTSRPDIIPELDRWYCYELMVKANTPGQRDGRIAAWLDGKLVMDFPNLRLRDVASLTIDRFGLSFHIYSNPKAPSKKWYDNVVAATEYIGPMAK